MFKNFSKLFIYFTVFLIPFYFFRFKLLGINTNIFEIVVLISFVLEIIVIAKSGERLKQFFATDRHGLQPHDDSGSVLKKSNWLLPILFLVIAFISASLSPDKTGAFGIFKGWFLVPVVFAWVVSKNFEAKNIWKILVPLFISLVIVSIWAILQKLGLISTLFYQRGDINFNQYIDQGRTYGPFDSPNFLAMFIIPVVFLTLPILFEAKPRTIKNFSWSLSRQWRGSKNILLAILSFLPVLALYFSGSRAGVIAFVIGLMVYANYRFINLQKAKKRQPFYSVLFTGSLVFINAVYLFYATHVFVPASGDDKLRVEIYHYATELLKKYNFWGLGLGQFQNKIAEISINNLAFQKTGLSYALHPHNLILAIWLNLGLLGLVVFLWLIISFFKNAFSSDLPIRAAVISSMTAILIHGLFDTTYFKNDLSAIFWLIFVISVMIKNEKNISDN